jgi:hypothetical protein
MKFKPFSETKYLWMTIVVLSIIAILVKSVYRAYIYENQINDFGFADASPNFFAGLIIMLFYYTQITETTFKKYAWGALLGLIGYELLQGGIFKGTIFDVKDIIASILGVGVSFLICTKLNFNSIFNGDKQMG